MSKTRLIHHIVFATKHRKPAINKENKRKLYAYIYGIITNHKCFLLRINGIEDHIHILVDLHPTVAVANLVKEIKQYSSHWIKNLSGRASAPG
ncbi:MAG: IS200/IS605 family transposase [Muribaculaceae bacterium]|nr:IS200/IS605 family transposase [Muribaculaceae bacterium]